MNRPFVSSVSLFFWPRCARSLPVLLAASAVAGFLCTGAVAAPPDLQEAQLAEREARTQRTNEGIHRVRQLQKESKDEKALQVLEEILLIDPHNPAALALRDVITTSLLYRRYLEVEAKRTYPSCYASEHFQASIRPRKNLDGPEPRSVTELNRVISVNFDNDRFDRTLHYVAEVTGVRFHPDWKALEQVGIRPEDRLTLSLDDVPAEVVLRRILGRVGRDIRDIDHPEYLIEYGVVIISTLDSLRNKMFVVVYDIRDLLVEVPYFHGAPGTNLNSTIQQLSGVEGGGEPERLSREELTRRIIDIIQNTVGTAGSAGWVDLGGGPGVIQELNGHLIITQTARNHREIEDLLKQLRSIPDPKMAADDE